MCIAFDSIETCFDELKEDYQNVKVGTTHLCSLKCTHVSLTLSCKLCHTIVLHLT
ncbi:hypothetical protein GIB67_003080 [Kingdonia uniflora]|uniref:Uncharacterized protein n=1 Tax=Kingdonia uniflora TaxID=39325 RepID=A0A7J7N681_9MAGN|nr:hypothetical protein GIB67_003080 [Kingdonia uniflora]